MQAEKRSMQASLHGTPSNLHGTLLACMEDSNLHGNGNTSRNTESGKSKDPPVRWKRGVSATMS